MVRLRRRPKERQRALVCKHPTCRRRMGHTTEQCFVRKRQEEASADTSRSSQSITTDDDTPSTKTSKKWCRTEVADDR